MILKSFNNLLITRSWVLNNHVRKINSTNKFETVFSFPFIKYIAIFNRLKVYHIIGSSIAVPGSGALEMLGIVPVDTLFIASYIGITGAILLSAGSIPFKNIIGFLYISEDNSQVKISAVDFWGKRRDRIVSSEDWKPLHAMKPKTMDTIYLTPELTDGSKYKLFIKFGHVLNSKKLGQVLE